MARRGSCSVSQEASIKEDVIRRKWNDVKEDRRVRRRARKKSIVSLTPLNDTPAIVRSNGNEIDLSNDHLLSVGSRHSLGDSLPPHIPKNHS